MSTAVDIAIVGSGINALTAGAMLAKAGKRVALFEREEVAGGCMRTETLAEGVSFDPLATTFVLGSRVPRMARSGPIWRGTVSNSAPLTRRLAYCCPTGAP